MITALTGRLAAAASLVLLLVLSPALAADPPGVLWETTSQMAMAGMPMQMPAQTHEGLLGEDVDEASAGRRQVLRCFGLQDGRQQGDLEDAVQRANADAGHGRADLRRLGFLHGRDPSHDPGHEHDDQAFRQEGRHLR